MAIDVLSSFNLECPSISVAVTAMLHLTVTRSLFFQPHRYITPPPICLTDLGSTDSVFFLCLSICTLIILTLLPIFAKLGFPTDARPFSTRLKSAPRPNSSVTCLVWLRVILFRFSIWFSEKPFSQPQTFR